MIDTIQTPRVDGVILGRKVRRGLHRQHAIVPFAPRFQLARAVEHAAHVHPRELVHPLARVGHCLFDRCIHNVAYVGRQRRPHLFTGHVDLHDLLQHIVEQTPDGEIDAAGFFDAKHALKEELPFAARERVEARRTERHLFEHGTVRLCVRLEPAAGERLDGVRGACDLGFRFRARNAG